MAIFYCRDFVTIIQMKLNQAIARRTQQLLKESGMTRYAFCKKTAMPYTTFTNIIKCAAKDVELSNVTRIAFAFDMTLSEFFASPLFDSDNIEDL